MPYKALAGLLIVGVDAFFCKECAQCVADLIQYAGLQAAVRTGNDTVGTPGIKTNAGAAGFVCSDRKLDFVAVSVDLRGAYDGKDRNIQPADACKGVCNILLLGAELGGIVQMPQAAAAAGTGHSTVHRDAIRRGLEHLVQNAESIALAVLDDAYPGFIAGRCTGNEHGLTLRAVGDTAAIAGQALYLQSENLIFL